MKTSKFILLAIICALLINSSCKKDNEGCSDDGCSPGRKVVQEVQNIDARLQLDNNARAYYVTFGINGTYDTQFYCRICNLPDSIKQNVSIGDHLIFSGKLKYGCNDFKPPIGGMEFYYLEITSIKRKL